MVEANLPGKLKSDISKKVKELVHHKTSYEYTPDEVEKMIKERQKATKNQGNLAHRRALAQTELQGTRLSPKVSCPPPPNPPSPPHASFPHAFDRA